MRGRRKTSESTSSARPRLRSKRPARMKESDSIISPTAAARGLRVLCVDDHDVLIEGLKARFDADGGIEIVGRLPTAARLEDEVERLQPDVVILDIEMPGPDAFESTDRMRRRHPKVPVLVLSAHIRDSFISASFRSGISGYFAKSDELRDIVRGIYEVARNRRGTFLLGPRVRERCRPPEFENTPGDPDDQSSSESLLAGAPKTLTNSLTARQLEILRMIGKGMNRTQIATEISRSVKTVDAHQTRIMNKLGLETRADLMRFAIREGLAQA